MNAVDLNECEWSESKFENIQSLLDVEHIDLTKPHGLLGLMCDNMKCMANRRLDLSYPLYGLHLLSMVSIGRAGYNNSKLSLFTLVSAESASGKDLGQYYLNVIAGQLNMSDVVYDSPRSDKDMILNLVTSKSCVIYNIDEVHSLFNNINSKNAATHQTSIGAELLKMNTSRLYPFSGNHKRELIESYSKQVSQLNKKLEKQDLTQPEKVELEKRNKWILTILDRVNFGVENPIVNFAGCSTPKNLDGLISEDNVDSGLAGRAIVIRCNEGRAPLNNVSNTGIDKYVLERLNDVKRGSRHSITSDEDASLHLTFIKKYYDLEEYRNDNVLGALYARLYERVTRISSLLAVESGVITKADVLYSLALNLRHIDDCKFLLTQSKSMAGELDHNEQDDALKQRILRFVVQNSAQGIQQSVLKQRVSKIYKTRSEKAFFKNNYEKMLIRLSGIMNFIVLRDKRAYPVVK